MRLNPSRVRFKSAIGRQPMERMGVTHVTQWTKGSLMAANFQIFGCPFQLLVHLNARIGRPTWICTQICRLPPSGLLFNWHALCKSSNIIFVAHVLRPPEGGEHRFKCWSAFYERRILPIWWRHMAQFISIRTTQNKSAALKKRKKKSRENSNPISNVLLRQRIKIHMYNDLGSFRPSIDANPLPFKWKMIQLCGRMGK